MLNLQRTVLVAGAQGVTGLAAAQLYSSLPDTKVYGLSRRAIGRWHDHRHILITQLAESGAGEETIRQIVGHVSKEVLRDYLQVRMKAKREALEGIVVRPDTKKEE